MLDKLEDILKKDITFILILGVAAAGIVGATSMFLQYGTGLTSEINLAEMFNVGKETGDFSAPASYAVGFLLARILEAPLVGILDIGGSLMTGVGVGIPALMLSTGMGFLIENFALSLLTGFVIGIAIGILIFGIRRSAKGLSIANATSIMVGAGNKTGEALGPLVLLSAVSYSIPTGVGAIIGAFAFYKMDKPIVGGAVLGAIVFAGLFLLSGGAFAA